MYFDIVSFNYFMNIQNILIILYQDAKLINLVVWDWINC